MSTEKVHFIAVGGSVMHNLALALKQKGFVVSGSDDELFEPSKSRLLSNGILTDIGWNPEKITTDLDAVIIGMHAKKDNPELIKAQELQLPIYSFPEYIYKQSIDKQRIRENVTVHNSTWLPHTSPTRYSVSRLACQTLQ